MNITFSSNINESMQSLINKIQHLDLPEMTREISIKLLPDIRHRIHREGLDASGQPIGTYSKEYMKVRTGEFSTNQRFSKGKNKGATKPTGVFTKGKNKGEQRPRFNRTNDTKVVISLTREMENDFSVQPDESGNFGLGYTNSKNTEKAGFVEHIYSKKIVGLTPTEGSKAIEIADHYINKALNG